MIAVDIGMGLCGSKSSCHWNKYHFYLHFLL